MAAINGWSISSRISRLVLFSEKKGKPRDGRLQLDAARPVAKKNLASRWLMQPDIAFSGLVLPIYGVLPHHRSCPPIPPCVSYFFFNHAGPSSAYCNYTPCTHWPTHRLVWLLPPVFLLLIDLSSRDNASAASLIRTLNLSMLAWDLLICARLALRGIPELHLQFQIFQTKNRKKKHICHFIMIDWLVSSIKVANTFNQPSA